MIQCWKRLRAELCFLFRICILTEFINFTGDYASMDNTFGTFLKRYDSNLNLIDTSNLLVSNLLMNFKVVCTFYG